MDFCDWSQDDSSDDFDWSRGKGGTPSQGTGPEKDHSTGTAEGRWIVICSKFQMNRERKR